MKRNVGSKVYGDKRWHIRVHIIRIMLIHFAHEDRLGTFQSSTCFMILREGSASQRKALSSSTCMESFKKARHVNGISSIFVRICTTENQCTTLANHADMNV
jgi:hypothetical protein